MDAEAIDSMSAKAQTALKEVEILMENKETLEQVDIDKKKVYSMNLRMHF
jgi:hypothetical protein